MKKIIGKLDKKTIAKLKPGDEVLYSGVLYTARDQAHKRLVAELSRVRNRHACSLPVDLRGEIIYYCGPCEGFSSAGPTTSSRMDKFTPALLNYGIAGMIGKGQRSEEVIASIKKNKAVYFLAIGGAGAYLAKCIKSAEPVAYKELGPEAIYRITVEDFPLIVGVDSKGNSVY